MLNPNKAIVRCVNFTLANPSAPNTMSQDAEGALCKIENTEKQSEEIHSPKHAFAYRKVTISQLSEYLVLHSISKDSA